MTLVKEQEFWGVREQRRSKCSAGLNLRFLISAVLSSKPNVPSAAQQRLRIDGFVGGTPQRVLMVMEVKMITQSGIST